MEKIPFAVQMYSVHKALAEDFEGTVRKVAAIGYKYVEFFGGLTRPAEQVKAICDENGLQVIGWHSAITDFAPESIKATIAYHKTLGNNTMVVPGLPSEMTCTAKAWHETAKRFNEIGKILADEGMRTGYHNHYTEFTPVDGEIPWDILAAETGKDFILQIDNGNAMAGGADPMYYLKKYPGRAYTFHFKPYGMKDGFDVEPAGAGDSVPYTETIDELLKQGVTKYVIAEYETEKVYSELDGVKVFYANMGRFLNK